MNGLRKAIFYGAFCLGLLLFLALPLTGAQRILFSPGPGVHDGKAACAQCHSAFNSLPDCKGCHPFASPYKSNSSFEFHSRLDKQACTDCHGEHGGTGDRYAGNRFKHDDFSVSRDKRCQGCHEAPNKGVHSSIKQDIGCGDCHTQAGWKGSKFTHEALSSAQASQCIACHSAPGDSRHQLLVNTCALCHQVGSWQRAGFNHQGLNAQGRVSCGVCHGAPKGEHRQVGLDCGRCHNTRYWDDD